MAILKVEASPGHTRSPHVHGQGREALPFFHGPMAPVSSASRRLEGKTSAGKTLSEASRFTFHNSIGTRKGLDAD